jgi:uncharacterized Zn finger protein (UPF0148 family)
VQPGEGAVEYAAELTEGLTREEAAAIIRKLLREPSADPRIKRCEICGYPFRDKTRPGNAKVCGPSCKTTRKTVQRAEQRARKDVNKPKRERRYDQEAFMRRLWNYEKPYDPDKLAQIAAAREQARLMGGGRRKPIRKVEY